MAKPDNNTPVLEWIAAALGALALTSVLAILAYEISTDEKRPPAFDFATERVEPAGERWYVGFRIRNSGDATASSVKVIGTAADGETAEVTLRYVPGGSEREGGLYFSNDPRRGVEFRVSGYERP